MELVIAAALVVLAVSVWFHAKTVGQGGHRGQVLPAPGRLEAGVEQAVMGLASLNGVLEERRAGEQKAHEAISRIERVVAGVGGKGRAGENLLSSVLSELPPEMVVHNFSIGGRVCEFALRLTDGKLLPIDSKWSGTELLGDEISDDVPSDQVRRRVDQVVCSRLREVAGYIDPSLTGPMAIVAVPDSAYLCCRKAHALGAQLRISIVPYSSAVPILLSIWNLHRAYSSDLDDLQIVAKLHEVSICLDELGDRIEGHLARGLKQASNAAFEMRSLVATASGLLDLAGAPSQTKAEPVVQQAV